MTLASALALLLATAPLDPLAGARGAFAAGDYALAERLALEGQAEPPAAALYLAGLARFRAGRPAEALEALDRAEAGADSAAAWHFNRGACLYQLARHAEAEAAFLVAAADPAFAPLALVNAGFAALDAGEATRAGELAARARGVATGPALELVEELEQALEAGPGRTGEPPASGSPAKPPAPAATPTSQLTAEAHLEAGWDSDALRSGTGVLERPHQSDGAGSPLVAAAAALAWRGPVLGATAQASYAFNQVAYLKPQARDRSDQEHDLRLAARVAPTPQLQLELSLFGQYALAGLSKLRGLQAAGGARLAASYDLSPSQTSRAGGSFTAKQGVGSEFASLTGDRWEADASHEVRWERLALEAGYRLRLERIGIVSTSRPPIPLGAAPCPLGCAVTDREPLSYLGQTGWLAARLEPWSWLRLDLDAGLEWRLYDDTMGTILTGPDGAGVLVGARQRHERRWFTGETAAFRVAPWLSLSLRHDWLDSRSALQAVPGGVMCPASQPACPPVGAVERWSKHVLTLGASLAW